MIFLITKKDLKPEDVRKHPPSWAFILQCLALTQYLCQSSCRSSDGGGWLMITSPSHRVRGRGVTGFDLCLRYPSTHLPRLCIYERCCLLWTSVSLGSFHNFITFYFLKCAVWLGSCVYSMLSHHFLDQSPSGGSTWRQLNYGHEKLSAIARLHCEYLSWTLRKRLQSSSSQSCRKPLGVNVNQ